MNEDNFSFLEKQIKFSGFGDGHSGELKEKMQQQLPEFTIFHQQDFGKDNVVATLQFRKSDQADMYFFNRYSLLLKNENQTDPVKQTFFIHAKEDNITLKEGYNLMNGRAVHKEMTPKEGEKYMAWVQLDFKNTDKQGNYEKNTYHQNYGFDLTKVLAQFSIKELTNESHRQRLIDSLERGNRQGVTLQTNGQELKVFIEAAPKFKGLNFYDESLKRVNVQTLQEKPGEAQGHKQEKKESHKKSAGDDDEGATGKSQKQSRKKGHRIG